MHVPRVQTQLFPPSIDSIIVGLMPDSPTTWRVSVWHRHGVGSDEGCPVDFYPLVTPAELLELVDASLSALLDWPG
jgi:hypothetical protein